MCRSSSACCKTGCPDGIFVVEVDGTQVAEIGPGAVVGERAALESGARTATLRATTRARVAEVPPDGLDPDDLDTLAATYHREGDVAANAFGPEVIARHR